MESESFSPDREHAEVIHTELSGYQLLLNPRLNKGTAFTEEERDIFALHGLLPPHVGTLEDQRERRMKALAAQSTSFAKYSLMRDLQDTTETLFYSLIAHHMEELLPIVYTPAVGEVSDRIKTYLCSHFPGDGKGSIVKTCKATIECMCIWGGRIVSSLPGC